MINFKELKIILSKLNKKNKKIVFTIGSTSKINNHKSYITPVRRVSGFIIVGVNIYLKKEFVKLAKIICKYVDYIFIDCEKKIKQNISIISLINEKKKFTNVFFYKGNDLTVEATDDLISYCFRKEVYGIQNKKICILGAGNIGSKLALKFVERGAKVNIVRRNIDKLKIITKALNIIKPRFEKQIINCFSSNLAASKDAEIILGCSSSKNPIVNSSLLRECKNVRVIVDIGKGSISKDAVNYAMRNSIKIFRLDISYSLLSMVINKINVDKFFSTKMGRKKIKNRFLVSGGQMGKKGDLIVDDFNKPNILYGIADGKGDFLNRFNNFSYRRFNKK
jgi:hypothetical protein